ncbi:hypothetical protein [Metallibacterium scheffleri]|uniref:Uncharacterized protein n=1 Tax=Metallibacterium scheffleri TaxID=993689 RepID=A0A4S3KKZ0_9GAMM|nr:hypothetical protein [Metallibacterium scheffleri]THD09409.1 hypothetical protein B1806_11075 [Metallibacterium scheffleri]
MHRLSERIAALEAFSGRSSEEQFRKLCEREGWTPEFLRSVLQTALDEVGPDDPSADIFRDAMKQLEAPDATV